MAQLLRRLLPILLPFALNWLRKRKQNKNLQSRSANKLGEQNVSGPFNTGGN